MSIVNKVNVFLPKKVVPWSNSERCLELPNPDKLDWFNTYYNNTPVLAKTQVDNEGGILSLVIKISDLDNLDIKSVAIKEEGLLKKHKHYFVTGKDYPNNTEVKLDLTPDEWTNHFSENVLGEQIEVEGEHSTDESYIHFQEIEENQYEVNAMIEIERKEIEGNSTYNNAERKLYYWVFVFESIKNDTGASTAGDGLKISSRKRFEGITGSEKITFEDVPLFYDGQTVTNELFGFDASLSQVYFEGLYDGAQFGQIIELGQTYTVKVYRERVFVDIRFYTENGKFYISETSRNDFLTTTPLTNRFWIKPGEEGSALELDVTFHNVYAAPIGALKIGEGDNFISADTLLNKFQAGDIANIDKIKLMKFNPLKATYDTGKIILDEEYNSFVSIEGTLAGYLKMKKIDIKEQEPKNTYLINNPLFQSEKNPIEKNSVLNKFEIGIVGYEERIEIPSYLTQNEENFEIIDYSSPSYDVDEMIFALKINNEQERTQYSFRINDEILIPSGSNSYANFKENNPLGAKVLNIGKWAAIPTALATSWKKPLAVGGAAIASIATFAKVNSMKNATIEERNSDGLSLTYLLSSPNALDLTFFMKRLKEPLYTNIVNHYEKYGISVFNKFGHEAFTRENFNFLKTFNTFDNLEIDREDAKEYIANKLENGVIIRHTDTFGKYIFQSKKKV